MGFRFSFSFFSDRCAIQPNSETNFFVKISAEQQSGLSIVKTHDYSRKEIVIQHISYDFSVDFLTIRCYAIVLQMNIMF